MTILIAGPCTLGLGIFGFAYRPIRRLEDELPDADPGAVILADKDKLQALADRQLVQA